MAPSVRPPRAAPSLAGYCIGLTNEGGSEGSFTQYAMKRHPTVADALMRAALRAGSAAG
ncbi:hypothetical protein BH11GEM1_BH11GEM1_18830 [soil metagenome]